MLIPMRDRPIGKCAVCPEGLGYLALKNIAEDGISRLLESLEGSVAMRNRKDPTADAKDAANNKKEFERAAVNSREAKS